MEAMEAGRASWGAEDVAERVSPEDLEVIVELDHVLCLLRSSPGVLTVVELNMTSSFVLAEGLKPRGVCACASPDRMVRRRDEEQCMLGILLLENKVARMYSVED
jgi:hypothetical protein